MNNAIFFLTFDGLAKIKHNFFQLSHITHIKCNNYGVCKQQRGDGDFGDKK